MAGPGTGLPQKRRRRIPNEHYDQISTMLIAMMPLSEILKQASAKFGKAKTYVREVVRQIHEDWEADAAPIASTRRNQIRQGMELLYRQANADKDWSTCAKILTELGRLDGVYAPERATVTHQGQVGVGISLGSLGFKSPQEVRDRVDWLKSQIAAKGASAVQGTQPQLVAQAHLSGEVPDSYETTNGVSTPAPIDVIDAAPSDDPEGTS